MNATGSSTPPAPRPAKPRIDKGTCCPGGECDAPEAGSAAAEPGRPAAPPAAGAFLDADALRDSVRAGYAAIATAGCAPGAGGGCCGPTALSGDDLARAIGYSQAELEAGVAEANLGLSCGNPTALAGLRPGEVLLDLGAGSGFDAFIAAPKLGPGGRVIGVDMTAEMIANARRNAKTFAERTGLRNIEFRLGEIEHLPVPDASVDVVISNCVLNLSPDKPQVWREIARVLKPGGRVAISDLALLRPLPDAVKADVEALVGCVAGAVLAEDTLAMAREAGLADVKLTSKPGYVSALTRADDPLYARLAEALPDGGPDAYVTSLEVVARKPA